MRALELPRHLRFARALALVSSLGACASSAPPAEPAPTPPPTSGGTATVDPCSRCVCYASTNPPTCYGTGSDYCCGVTVEGPLPPPDLSA